MVDYSKFNNIEDSDDEEGEAYLEPNANEAQRWMHRQEAKARQAWKASGEGGGESSSDEESEDEGPDDGEGLIAWARKGGDVVEDQAARFTANMRSRDRALGGSAGDATMLWPAERSRHLLAHSGGGPNGLVLSMVRVRRESPGLGSDADAIVAALRDGPPSPWAVVPAVCSYVYKKIAETRTEFESQRLRESSEAGAALGWMASRYLEDEVPHEAWPPAPDACDLDRAETRARCERIVEGLYPLLSRKVFDPVLTGRPVDPTAHCPLRKDADLFGQPVLSASLLLAAPALLPFLPRDAVRDVGTRTIVALYACDTLDASAPGWFDAPWRLALVAGVDDDTPVPRGDVMGAFSLPGTDAAALVEAYAPLLDPAVDAAAYAKALARPTRGDWSANSRAAHARHCALATDPAPAKRASCRC